MPRRSFTTAEKIRHVEGWVEARARGERQEHFAARVGIDARRLRDWIGLYGPIERMRSPDVGKR
jgi:hypothetical protein